MQNGKRLRLAVSVSIFGVLSYLLMLVEIPILPLFPFLKLDFSDLIPLCGLAIFGFGGASGVVLIRALLHLIMTGFSAQSLIGELGSVIASLTILLLAQLILQKQQKGQLNWQRRVLLVISGTLVLTVVMAILNYFVLTPLYIKVTGFKLGMDYLKYVLFAIIPFNLIKGVLVVGLFTVVYARMGAWLQSQYQSFHQK
ncbi:ECF transporter S component [Lapidilactobacillus wuchangensis]|uniref:ECF transporter S component n=1 Tax=Lapidilactobacillus wuchangensis TaxID=2486001 RepID=UPI000F78070B|nr:ECF transporter S component [Lapidilactobacillus wuchangensis]